MCLAACQAYVRDANITPTITAVARSVATVTAVTKMVTKASDLGTFLKIKIDLHANVPITTINITPTKAANGICSIIGLATNINKSKNKAEATAAKRVRPPELTLIIDWPIIAQPPMPPKKPVATLATPCATDS